MNAFLTLNDINPDFEGLEKWKLRESFRFKTGINFVTKHMNGSCLFAKTQGLTKDLGQLRVFGLCFGRLVSSINLVKKKLFFYF